MSAPKLTKAEPAMTVSDQMAAYAALWRLCTDNPTIHQARRDLLAAIGGKGSENQRAALEWLQSIGTLQAENTRLAARIEEVERERDEALAALRPFAALYSESMRDFPDGSAKPERPDERHAWGFNNTDLSWGDFRRAREALGKEAG